MGGEITTPPAYQRPNGKLQLSASQLNINTVTWTKVLLDQIPSDFTDGIEDTVNNRIDIPVAGFYLLIGQATFGEIVANKKYQVNIKLNGGATGIVLGNALASHVDFLYVQCVDVYYLDTGDYIDLNVYHDAGVNTVDIIKDYTHLTCQRVR